eukprot:2122128-Amphidinium_carterae.1
MDVSENSTPSCQVQPNDGLKGLDSLLQKHFLHQEWDGLLPVSVAVLMTHIHKLRNMCIVT